MNHKSKSGSSESSRLRRSGVPSTVAAVPQQSPTQERQASPFQSKNRVPSPQKCFNTHVCRLPSLIYQGTGMFMFNYGEAMKFKSTSLSQVGTLHFFSNMTNSHLTFMKIGTKLFARSKHLRSHLRRAVPSTQSHMRNA